MHRVKDMSVLAYFKQRSFEQPAMVDLSLPHGIQMCSA